MRKSLIRLRPPWRRHATLPADRAKLALAQCAAMVGDAEEAHTLIQAALQSPGCDLRTIQVAVDLYINLGRFDQVEPILDKLNSPTFRPTPEALAWANRTRSLARLSTGRLDELERALAMVEKNLKDKPASIADLKLKGIILALRTSRRSDAIKLLESLDKSNQLGATEEFILARAYLAEGLVAEYQSQMVKILAADVKNPQQLVHFVNVLITRQELDQAELWLAELRRVAPARRQRWSLNRGCSTGAIASPSCLRCC